MRLPLAAGGASYEAPSSSSPEQAPAPMAWTPMRASALAPAAGAGSGLRSFGLKRLREGEAPSAPGTPLLQAGLASEAGRRTRQRSDKVGSLSSSKSQPFELAPCLHQDKHSTVSHDV